MNNIFEILKQTTQFESIPSNIQGATVSEDIIITQQAMDMLINEYNANYLNNTSLQPTTTAEDAQNTAEPAYFVRLFMQSTADKSKQYNIKFDNKTTAFDNIYQLGKINIVVDRKSLFYFMGVIIDYVKNDNEEGFVFLDTDDQKVSDYYLFLSKGQDWLDYTDAIGKSMQTIIQNDNDFADVNVAENDVLYQDEIYDENEAAVNENLQENVNNNTVDKLPLSANENILAEQQTAEQTEHDTAELMPMPLSETATTEEGIIDANTLNKEQNLETNDDNALNTSMLQDLEIADDSVSPHSSQPVDKTKFVQKRTITGIHFQD